MATWQFHCSLISRQQILDRFGEIPTVVSEECVEDAITWISGSLETDCANRISSILPERKSWSSVIRKWGDEVGNDASLLVDEDVSELSVRIDVRRLDREFIEGFLNIAKSVDALILVTENKEIIQPEYKTLMSAIQNSSAARFVNDPIKFLTSLPRPC